MVTESVSQTKSALRRWIGAQLRGASSEQRSAWSSLIVRQLIRNELWVPEAGQVVALFGGLKLEVDVMPLFSWLQERGCQVAFFAIEGDHMTPWLIRQHSDLKAGQMGVLEPVADPVNGVQIPISDINVVITPGIAFDRQNGMRLGRGKGYYDRVFADPSFKGVKLGVGFDLQVVSGVPFDSYDKSLDHLVTEQTWLTFPQVTPANPS